MRLMTGTINTAKALILISLIVVVTIVDTQFVHSAFQMINKKCRKRSYYHTGETHYWGSVCDPMGLQ
jgi:uncharacterized membrane protein